jgi:ABC-2 type transport system permease protein
MASGETSNPFQGLWTLVARDVKGWYKNTASLFLALAQPIVWLLLYGKAIDYGAIFSSGAFTIPGLSLSQQELNSLAGGFVHSAFGTGDYFSFLSAGMLAFIVLFGASLSGVTLVFERRSGFLGKVLSTPVSRGTVVLSKVLTSVVKSMVQAVILIVIAVALGMQTSRLSVGGLIGTFVALFLLAVGLSSIFVVTALRTTNWQVQLAVLNFISVPLLFASNALFPVKFMPTWMQYIAQWNPMTYVTDAARQLLLGSTGMVSLTLDFGFLAAFALIFLGVGSVLSRRYLVK